jgi:Uma2 family endonuclease
MKALILKLSDEELARRRLTGIDRYDEMWEGVLHMPPAPAYEHQRLVSAIDRFLGLLCERRERGVLAPAVNVFNKAAANPDYRIPDLTFVATSRRDIIARDGIRGGGPDAVIEIRSPDDETYDKLPFFARLGVGEVIVVDRDTKKPEIYRLSGSQYLAVHPDFERWLRSEVLKVRLACTEGRLLIEDLDDPSARVELQTRPAD